VRGLSTVFDNIILTGNLSLVESSTVSLLPTNAPAADRHDNLRRSFCGPHHPRDYSIEAQGLRPDRNAHTSLNIMALAGTWDPCGNMGRRHGAYSHEACGRGCGAASPTGLSTLSCGGVSVHARPNVPKGHAQAWVGWSARACHSRRVRPFRAAIAARYI